MKITKRNKEIDKKGRIMSKMNSMINVTINTMIIMGLISFGRSIAYCLCCQPTQSSIIDFQLHQTCAQGQKKLYKQFNR